MSLLLSPGDFAERINDLVEAVITACETTGAKADAAWDQADTLQHELIDAYSEAMEG